MSVNIQDLGNTFYLLLSGSFAGLLLIFGRHLSRIPAEKIQDRHMELQLILRYTYGTLCLLAGDTIFLIFVPDVSGTDLLKWLLGIAVIAGGIRVLVGLFDLGKSWWESEADRKKMDGTKDASTSS